MPHKKTVTDVGVPELYRECLAAQQNLTKENLEKLELMFARAFLFDGPLFDPPPTVDEFSIISKKTRLKIRRQAREAYKYRAILDIVRKQTKLGNRLFYLAKWLHQEKVCKPEDILGIEALRRLAKKTVHFSFRDFHHANRVRKWLPYFEKLLTDFRTYKGDVSKLVKREYNEETILAARKKRSSVPAACDWLAGCDDSGSKVDALTLQNAYSRVYGPKRRSVHKSRASH